MKSTKSNLSKVYLTELERFGYTLKAIGRTKKEAEDAVIAEYIRTFKNINGTDPAEEDTDRYFGDDRSCLDVARDELYTEEVEFGKVLWA